MRTFHLLVNELQQTLAAGQDPLVHDVGVVLIHARVKHEVDIFYLLEQRHLSFEELVAVPQREQDALYHFLHACFLEAQRLRADDRRIDEVQTESIRTVLGHDNAGIRVVLEPLGHLLAVLGEYDSVHDAVLER